MKILLTGGAGFIGSHTYVELFNAGHEAVIVDNFYNASPRVLERLETITGKTVSLECRLSPNVLGGIRLDYDGIQVDGTVQSRLDAVAGLLKNTVL